ncbi:serine/threonine-protein kinase [Deinococcus altitudinis]|uniref:serine/threonine-protein kinase n=1 Tax=Deinococcus altitudinis TaxID=468914 RepID=UPI0038923710
MAQDSSEHHSSETVVSGYRLLRGLGRGNTSRVFLAEKVDPEVVEPAEAGAAAPTSGPLAPAVIRAGTRVALKLPLPETLADQGAAERFANEVRLTLQFRHPRLVAGIDGTPFGANCFLAMHHYEGGTLARRLSGSQLNLNSLLQVLADVASGMAHLHQAGAVHQDVKTQNVYLEHWEEGEGYRAALGDFGSTYFLAQGGQVSGSPYYMAPEVYQGETTGPPSDVYSFGVMAHELLSGERPHRGDSYEKLMVSHLTHFPPPLHTEGLSRSLARLLDSALAKRPADRPDSAALRRALLSSLGKPDESGAQEEAEQAAPTAPPVRSYSGRHGQGTDPARQNPVAPAARSEKPKAAPPAVPEKRGWNPFKKK